MTVYYQDTCTDEDIEHFCDDCEAQEGARIRSVFFQKEDYEFSDATSKTEWQTAVAAGNVVVIPKTHGTFDGGSPNYGPGFGDEEQRYLNSTFKLNYFDPNLKNNYEFYEAKKRSKTWRVGFRTSTLVWISDRPATITPKAVVSDNEKEGVVWEVEVTWNSANNPEPFTMPEDIFQCFLVD